MRHFCEMLVSCLLTISLGAAQPNVHEISPLEIMQTSSDEPLDHSNRPCNAPAQHTYKHRYTGIGYEILDSESEACSVPDDEYRLLDNIVAEVLARSHYDPSLTGQSAASQAARISKSVSDTMDRHGFEEYVDTETLSDALFSRGKSKLHERHIYDCDTGSFIFLTVAENLKAPVVMVEIPNKYSDVEHNYVRWVHHGESFFEWDMNAKSSRSTPEGLTGNYGKSMRRDATLGYALALRAKLWERQKRYDRVLDDLRASMKTYSGLMTPNNLAWLIATKDIANRKTLVAEALSAAQTAATGYPKPNYLDTLACVYALNRDFKKAEEIEQPFAESSLAFSRRLKLFRNKQDCTGEE